MNPLTRLYRSLFPIPEPSRLVKGLIKAIEEQKPTPFFASKCTRFTLSFGGDTVSLTRFWDDDIWIHVANELVDASKREILALAEALNRLTWAPFATQDEMIAAKQAPIIALVEKLGCPTEFP